MVFQDLLKKRHTEIDYINGLVVSKGQEAKVPTPLNATVASVIKEIESGKIQQGLANYSKFPAKEY
jgi:2-dehydropantoate 2-reductase